MLMVRDSCSAASLSFIFLFFIVLNWEVKISKIEPGNFGSP